MTNSLSTKSHPSSTGQPGLLSRHRGKGICLLLALITWAVYWPVRTFEFVNIDDWAYVTENSHVAKGLSWENFQWAFQTHFAANWHPITTLSHMLDCTLFGLNAGAHHFTNLFFHTLNTLLLFALLRRMTRAFWRSALVAALFALHPLHVESVAWISERKDVLSGFFFLLTLWAYARYAEQRANRRLPTFSLTRSLTFYFLALVFFALGLLSKPMLVTLPFVLLLLDFWPLQRIKNLNPNLTPARNLISLLLEKLPFFMLAAISSAITFVVQKGDGAVVALEHFPILPRLANVLVSYVRYLGKTVWPESLAIFYPYEGHWSVWTTTGAIGLLVAISIFSIWIARRTAAVFVGWCWFLGMLVPVIGVVQVGSQSMADRYVYLPHIGFFMAVIWGVFEWSGKSVFKKRLAHSVAVAVVAACAVATFLQVRHWKNTRSLLEHAIAVTRGNAPAHYYLGFVSEKEGRDEEAIAQYLAAVNLEPGFSDAHCNLGNIYSRQKNPAQAEIHYRQALLPNPNYYPAHYSFALLLTRYGKFEEAKKHYRAAIAAKPNFAEAHYQLAVLLADEKSTAEAISHFERAMEFKKDWLEPLNNLAWILATHLNPEIRDGTAARKLAERACDLSKYENPGALDTLSAAFAENGDFLKAVATAEIALSQAGGNEPLAQEIKKHLASFQRGEPWRQE